jgi:hypothetical protein
MRYKEISYHADMDGLGYHAAVYERTEPSDLPRYYAQRWGWDRNSAGQLEIGHVSTLRTESLESATEYAQEWTGTRPFRCQDQCNFY